MKWKTLACMEHVIYTAALLSNSLDIEKVYNTFTYKSTDEMREVVYFDDFYSIFNYHIWAHHKEVGSFFSMDFSNRVFVVRLV